MKIARFFIITFLLVGLLPAQGELKLESYWIYTYSSEMKDYQINGIENDQLVLNNGSWDVKIPIAEIEIIALPPKPGLLGQILGGGCGAYGGGLLGMTIGCLIFPSAVVGVAGGGGEGVVQALFFVGALAGAYYGSKLGGGILKGNPEILVDMTMWTVDEKKDWIQTNLIY